MPEYPIIATYNTKGLSFKAQKVGEKTVDLFVTDANDNYIKLSKYSGPFCIAIHPGDDVITRIETVCSLTEGAEFYKDGLINLAKIARFPFSVIIQNFGRQQYTLCNK